MPRPLDAAAPTVIDANERELLPAERGDLAQRAETSTQEIANLHEAAATREMPNRLLLRRPPLKPTGDVLPPHPFLDVRDLSLSEARHVLSRTSGDYGKAAALAREGTA